MARLPFNVIPAKVGLLVVAISWGSERVMAPEPLVILIWLLVPVRVLRVKPVPLPINSWPLAAEELFKPVPPYWVPMTLPCQVAALMLPVGSTPNLLTPPT